MFLITIFKKSFQLNKILTLRHLKFWKFLIYFLIVSTISLFSYNFTNLKEGGWKLGFVEHNFLSVENAGVRLPNNITIRQLSGVNGSSDFVVFKDSKNGDIIYRFEPTEENLNYELNVRQLLFTNKAIYYIKGDGQSILEGTYNGFPEEISFESINNSPNKKEELIKLASYIEKSFGSQNAFFTIITFSAVQIVLYIILLLVLGLLIQLFRFGYTNFMSYLDGIKIVIASMTIPSIVSFFVGFFTHALTPFIIQFGIAIILMIVMLKYGKREFIE